MNEKEFGTVMMARMRLRETNSSSIYTSVKEAGWLLPTPL